MQDQKLLLKKPVSEIHPDSKPESKLKENKIRVDDDKNSSVLITHSSDGLETFSSESVVLQGGRKALEVGDEKEHKQHPPRTEPLQSPSTSPLQHALQSAYRDKHSLRMPLSDKSFPIQAVSLTINDKGMQEAKRHRPEEKETKGTPKTQDKHLSWSTQLQRDEDWHKVEKPLEIKAIFKSHVTAEAKSISPICRVLVEGRAGVGKTTFSQYIAWQWATAGLFSSEYEYVLLVPLRRWLSGPVTENFQEELAAFIYETYCPTDIPDRFKELQAIVSNEHNSRTLLILDGYDEVAHYLDEPDSAHGKLLLEALQFKHLIVTTRDYQLPPARIRFDRQLVNIGFTDGQIKHYLQHYSQWLNPTDSESEIKEKDSKYKTSSSTLSSPPSENRLNTALRQNPRLWVLAHVPLNLALIVEAFGDELGESKDSDGPTHTPDVSLTALYQKVLECFLLRQLERQGIKPKVYTAQSLRNRQFIALDALSLLAWEAFHADEIMLSAKTQQAAFARLKERYPTVNDTDLEAHFLQALDMGLLRSEGIARKNWLDQSRYFIHLTFQEYFTAYYLLQNLQGYYGVEAGEESLAWIAQHKYEPRYAVVMGFLAGGSTEIGYDQSLHAFWHTLLSPPHDIVGASHVRLVMHCLEEARLDKRILAQEQLLDVLSQWMNYVLQDSWRDNEMIHFMDTLCTCPKLIRDCRLVAHYIEALQDKNKPIWVRRMAADALGKISTVAPRLEGLLPALLQGLWDEVDGEVRMRAANALGQIGAVAPNLKGLLPALLQALQDGDYIVRPVAARALGRIGAVAPNLEGLLPALLQALQNENYRVRSEAAYTLGKIGVVAPNLEGLLPALLQALQDENMLIRKAAGEALGQIGAVAPNLEGLLPALLQALQNKHEYVREAAAKALGQIGAVAPSLEGLLPGILQALQDKDKYVRGAAAKALGQIGTVAPSLEGLLLGILQALQDKHEYVREAAAKALGQIGAVAPSLEGLLPGILQALQDKHEYVREAAAKALCKIGAVAPNQEKLLPALLQALQHKDNDVRKEAAEALGKIGSVAPNLEGLLPALLRALQDKDRYVRKAAASALGKIGAVTPNLEGLLPALLQALQDEEKGVRNVAAQALGNIGAVAPNLEGLLPGLLQALQDKESYVREAAAEALGQIGAVAPSLKGLLPALVQALKDKEWLVQLAATNALSQIALAEHVSNYLKVVHQGITEQTMVMWCRAITQNFPGIIWQSNHLQLITGTQSASLTISDMTDLEPLLAAIQKCWKNEGLPPPPTLAECQGKAARYPAAKKPAFKPITIPASSILLPAKPDEKKRGMGGSSTQDETLSPAQRLKQKFPLPTPLSTLSRFELAQLNSTGRMVLDFTIAYQDLEVQEPPLGRGAFGAVYRGTYRREVVAIKRFLLDDFSLERQKEIRSEASVMASIPSDHIVHLRGICLQAPHYCVVMEYLPKGDLYGLLHPKKKESSLTKPTPLSLSQRYRLAADMAIGLYRLHENGILHRDLKSLNVLLHERDGQLRAKLSDFGLATLKRSLLHSKDGMVGSLPWLAPEIVMGTGEYSKASDVYGLGMVLYELATGKVPFYDLPDKPATPSVQQIKAWVAAGERPWKYLPEDCPVELAQLIRDCCAEEPKDRPTANVVVDRLEKLYLASQPPKESKKQDKKGTHDKEVKEHKYASSAQSLSESPPTSTPSKYVASLIQKGNSIDQRDEHGRSFLHRALAAKDIDLVQALLKQGARIDLPDKKGVTPLDVALSLDPSGEPLVALLLDAHKPSFVTTSPKLSEYARLLQATIQWGLGAEQEMVQRSLRESKQGPSSAAIALEAYAGAWGYACHDMQKDGNCFYYAISHQLQQQLGILIPYDILRAIATHHVLEHMALYSGGVDQSMHTFIDKMSRDKTWADQVHLLALSRALNLTLVIMRSDKKINVLRRSDANATLYLGYEVGLHYQSLTPQTPTLCAKLKTERVDKADLDTRFKGGLSLIALKKLGQPLTPVVDKTLISDSKDIKAHLTPTTSTKKITMAFSSSSASVSQSVTTSTTTHQEDKKRTQPPGSGSTAGLFPHTASRQAFQQKLQQLCEENGYTFSITRPQPRQLIVRFTAVDSVLAETDEIRKELVALSRLWQKLMTDTGITIKPNQLKPDWKNWSLTITADTATLNPVAKLLCTASAAYLQSQDESNLMSDTPEVASCAMQ